MAPHPDSVSSALSRWARVKELTVPAYQRTGALREAGDNLARELRRAAAEMERLKRELNEAHLFGQRMEAQAMEAVDGFLAMQYAEEPRS